MPPHDPSRRRLKSSWDVNIIQRYISIIEDGFYQSPNHIYHQCKGLCYALTILITGSFTLGLTDIGLLLLVPFFIVLSLTILYILRFNIKGELKEVEESILPDESLYLFADTPPPPDIEEIDINTTEKIELGYPEYFHSHYEHPVFRILSIFFWASLIIVCSILIIFWCYYFLGVIPSIFMFLITIMSSLHIFKRDERDTDQSHYLFFWVFVFITATIFFIGNYNQGDFKGDLNWAQNGVYLNRSKQYYPICDKKWEGLSIVDFGFLSTLAYSREPYFTKDKNIWFSHLNGSHVV
jgi:hypothetical protein